jgi:UBX domain-containing protein 1
LIKNLDKIIFLGQAFYAGGSERSGQQIIGPPKPNVDKKVTKLFEAARKQGAMEAEDDEHGSAHTKKEKAFGGVGYTLG